jgi:hypothetical protein
VMAFINIGLLTEARSGPFVSEVHVANAFCDGLPSLPVSCPKGASNLRPRIQCLGEALNGDLRLGDSAESVRNNNPPRTVYAPTAAEYAADALTVLFQIRSC